MPADEWRAGARTTRSKQRLLYAVQVAPEATEWFEWNLDELPGREIHMKQVGRYMLVSFAALALAGFAGLALAQQKTVEEKQTGPAKLKVDTRDMTVAYIEGDHLVVRRAGGSLEAIRIPPGERFNIEGQKLTLHELKPGMTLTDEIFTTERPVTVKTVEITEGRIFFVGPRRLIIHTKDGEAIDYQVPEWATVKINGQERSLHELKRGQTITATIITETPMNVVEQEKRSHGHPLTSESKSAVEPKLHAPLPMRTEVAPAQLPESKPVPETKLPATASYVPLIGLAGIFALAIAAALKAFEKG